MRNFCLEFTQCNLCFLDILYILWLVPVIQMFPFLNAVNGSDGFFQRFGCVDEGTEFLYQQCIWIKFGFWYGDLCNTNHSLSLFFQFFIILNSLNFRNQLVVIQDLFNFLYSMRYHLNLLFFFNIRKNFFFLQIFLLIIFPQLHES